MRKIYDKMIESGLDVYDSQKEAFKYEGDSLMIYGGMGTGKTESALLAIKEGSIVDWILPTPESCIFMYKRLVYQFGEVLNLEVVTPDEVDRSYSSTLKEGGRIRITIPDPVYFEYISDKRESTTLVIDEMGEKYPPDVRSMISDYIDVMESLRIQVIIISSEWVNKGDKKLI